MAFVKKKPSKQTHIQCYVYGHHLDPKKAPQFEGLFAASSILVKSALLCYG